MSKRIIKDLLNMADININGSHPWDIQIHDEKVFSRVLQDRSVGLGETYMDGMWDCGALDQFFAKLIRAKIENKVRQNWKVAFQVLCTLFYNPQSKKKSLGVAEQHYNLGNELYQHMLGPSMAYSCGYYKNTSNLGDAQYAKYDLICQKLDLQSHHRVLDLGCGFGGFAKYAATHYGCEVVGVNISKQQLHYARAHAHDLPITYVESDYRDIRKYNPQGKAFDRIVSVGFFEHVGVKNYQHFFNIAKQNISSKGLFLLHTIGDITKKCSDPWIKKYIFPHCCLPSIPQLSHAMESNFIMEDWHNFGPYYDFTLMDWDANFRQHWLHIADQYDERFYKMWRYYLMQCAAAFRVRDLQLWQIVLSQPASLRRGFERVNYKIEPEKIAGNEVK